ncbi:ion transporter [Thalassomonas sp. M1454]|uniref:ion transporter n=1 Tax=Thalassomonas sp. M1454 TaxID=2594477 RepID=UPI00117F5134|nr:ion transporter [Thalassomonas sp. M1454]TRX54952.1 ion transporter [Thalassomonas sp. M1454]
MSQISTLRKQAFQLLERHNHNSVFAKYFNLFLIILIITNVIAVIFESDAKISQQYHAEFALFEVISISIFTIEYLVRLWVCVESYQLSALPTFKARLKYIMSPIAIIDLIAIAPFFISLFISIDLRQLRLLRVMRLLKLTHYFKGFTLFVTVVAKEIKSITATIMVMLFLIVIAASMMYTLENEAQPEVFGNILHSLWWSVVTMTTVGYGDVTPVTTLGKIVATFIMLIGVAIVALPAGLLAARFGDELRERKRNLNAHIKHALSDGVIDSKEYRELEELADRLELRDEDLDRAIKILKKEKNKDACPHCGK